MTRFFTWARILYMFYVNGATFTLFHQDYILAVWALQYGNAVIVKLLSNGQLTITYKHYVYLKKANSYITRHPVLRMQSALNFIWTLTDLFTQTPSRILWEASSHMLQLMHGDYSYTYPPLSIVRYSVKQLSELEQCILKQTCPRF